MTTKPSCEVVVAGGEVGAFGLWPDSSLQSLALPVLAAALRDAGVQAAQLEAAYVGNAFGGLMQGHETMLGQMLLPAAGIESIPVHNIKNACSSGADAMALAWSAVAYGQYDCVLVLGVEKMTHPERSRAMAVLASASDRQPTDAGRSVFMDLNAERAKNYMRRYGATPRHFALCAAKNRRHASLNPQAAVRTLMDADAILQDRMVLDPLTRAMCGGIADGAAAVVLVSSAFARRHGLHGPKVRASCVVSGQPQRGADAPSATARSGALAFAAAGLDPRDVSLAEVHDPTAPQELIDIEDLGLCAPGQAFVLTESGHTQLGGRMPVNVSGGLTCRGHPVGATGVAQIVELSRQLSQRAGPAQVQGARWGLAQMAGGLLGSDSAVACVHLLERA
jgi:acetyl-CoA acetyltransferase